MRYFSKVKQGEKVFSIIYGKGIVIFSLPKEHRLDGFFIFAVKYSKKTTVYYTVDGFPNWSSGNSFYQTVFYKKDINFDDMDMQNIDNSLSEKKIVKYKDQGMLEIQCPSGIWRNIDDVPERLVDKALQKSKFYLFRKSL